MFSLQHQTTLCEAISARKLVKLKYDHDLIEKIFAPYIVFYSGEGDLSVSGYQINNPQKPREGNVWRYLTVEKLKLLNALDSGFKVDPNFAPTQKRFGKRIVCCVRRIP